MMGNGSSFLILVLSCLTSVVHIFMIWALFNFGHSFPHECTAWAYFTLLRSPCVNCIHCFNSRFEVHEVGKTNTVTHGQLVRCHRRSQTKT